MCKHFTFYFIRLIRHLLVINFLISTSKNRRTKKRRIPFGAHLFFFAKGLCDKCLVAQNRFVAHVAGNDCVDGHAQDGGGGTAACDAGPFHNPIHGRLDGGMGHADTDTEVDGGVHDSSVDDESDRVVLKMESGRIDNTAQIKSVVVADDDAVLDSGVSFDGDRFHIKVFVEREREHAEHVNGEFGMAAHQVLAQIGGDIDGGADGGGVGAVIAAGVVGGFLAAAHHEGHNCDNGENTLFHNELNFRFVQLYLILRSGATPQLPRDASNII